MKPILLTISGWGPYKDRTVVDFTQFQNRNLFLITGQTGAGKTTIFDALTYALFGTLSGDIREKGSVRSDFADEDTKTYVELTMSHRGKEYYLYRNPEYLRPKKRKTGTGENTKEKENASLTMSDGTIIAGNNDVTEKMKEILAMDVNQFKQISMIAQGDFARMILASPADKTSIFRDIFSTGLYAKIQTKLKELSADLLKEYTVFKNKMEEDIHILPLVQEEWNQIVNHDNIDFVKAVEFLEQQYLNEKKQTEYLIKEQKKLEKQILTVHQEKTSALQINRQFEDYENVQIKQKQLEDNADKIKQQESQLVLVKKAQAFQYEEKEIIECERRISQMKIKQTDNKNGIEQLKKRITAFQKFYDAREMIQEAFGQHELLTDKLQKISEYSHELTKIQPIYEKLQKEYQLSQDETDKKKKTFDMAQSDYRKAVVGIAAKLVKEGEPCPVCGSLSHPNVASMENAKLNEEYLENLKKQYELTSEQCNQLFAKTLQQKKECELKEKQLKEEVKEKETQESILKDLPEFIREYISENPQNARKRFVERMNQYQSDAGTITEKEKKQIELTKEMQEEAGLLTAKKEKFICDIQNAGFADESEYRAQLTYIPQMDNISKQISLYKEEKAATGNLINHLCESLKGKTKINLEKMNDKIIFLEEQKAALDKDLKQKEFGCGQIKQCINGIKENYKKAEKVAKEYGVVKDLDDLANGNNPKRLVFEQYVLAGYFERILCAANMRLKTMTEGRYELRRAKQVTDGRRKDYLEITVMDFYSGKERSVKTLSGGETFKASLALALGMSDCIQAESGGVQIETLFVDEGFGALDEESLNQACNTLQSLAETNKMIGIISHVPELRDRIDNQIIVEKYPSGGSYVKVL